MKKLVLVLLLLNIGLSVRVFSQTDSVVYFSEEVPGDSAIIFAPDIISKTNRYEYAPYFSPDGKSFYFGVTNAYWNGSTLWQSKFVDGNWMTPEIVGATSDMDVWAPTVSNDGATMYFSSAFPAYPPANIWKSNILNHDLSAPVKLEDPVNSSNDEWRANETDNKALVFSSDRSGTMGQQDLVYSIFDEGVYQEPVNFGIPVNSTANDASAYVSPDGDFMIFESTRSGGYGQADLYITYKKENGGWTNPKNMGSKINGPWIEDQPSLTPDGKYLLFCKREAGYTEIPTHIYWIESEIIGELKRSNYVPYQKKNIPPQQAKLGVSFEYKVPDSVFVDDDGQQTLTFKATLTNGSALPEWLNFDDSEIVFSGIPNQKTSISIRLTVTDTDGEEVSDIFDITVLEQGEKEFIMDGLLDSSAELVAENAGQHLYIDWDPKKEILYLATEAATINSKDVFFLLSGVSDGAVPSPWGKAGTVLPFERFMGNESDNNWSGWFNKAGEYDSGIAAESFASDTLVEAIINIQEELGFSVEQMYIAVGIYDTDSGGNLVNQIPAGNGDTHIGANEFYVQNLVSVREDDSEVVRDFALL